MEGDVCGWEENLGWKGRNTYIYHTQQCNHRWHCRPQQGTGGVATQWARRSERGRPYHSCGPMRAPLCFCPWLLSVKRFSHGASWSCSGSGFDTATLQSLTRPQAGCMRMFCYRPWRLTCKLAGSTMKYLLSLSIESNESFGYCDEMIQHTAIPG